MNAAPRNSSEPPYTNRGVKASHKFYDAVFSLDWLRLTVWTDMEGIAPLLEIYGFPNGLESAGYGGIGFRTIYQGSNGFQVYSDPVNSEKPYVSINMPSKAIQHIGLEAIMDGHSWLCEAGLKGLRWNCTRIDLAFDTQGFSVKDFEAAYHDGNVKTRARKWKNISDSDDGHTFYVGTRESMAMARVYHKMDGHSFGENVPFTRVELELKDDRAAFAVYEVLQAGFNDMAALAANILTGFMTVVSEWWEKFMVDVKAAWVRVRQNIPTVESIKNWLYSQVATSLVTYIGAVSGGETHTIKGEIDKLITQGKKGLQNRHYEMMRNYQADTAIEFAGGF